MRGVGYYVKELKRHLRAILGLDRTVRVAILGAGNLGLALADYPGFRQEGFAIVALFDTERSQDRAEVARRRADWRHRASFVGASSATTSTSPWWPCPPNPRRASSTRPCRRASGRFSNFSPGTLKVPPGVKLKNVDLTVSLESLSFFLARGDGDAENG